jgi:ribosomal protein L11 methyltransferase
MRVLILSVPQADAELASDRLWAAGAGAVEERSLASGTIALRTVLAESDQTSLDRLGALEQTWQVTFETVDPAPLQTWRTFVHPIQVNDSLVIRPAWLAAGVAPAVHEVSIEPGGSFGLGDHPTTRLSADAVWRLTRHGARVLDVGCGSGVLSIIAAHRGAGEVVAIDIAEAAREATDDNAARNGLGKQITASTTPVGDVDGEYDLVVANILAPVLVTMAHDLRRLTASAGHLILSGVLADGYDHVLAALQPMQVVESNQLDGWASVELRHSR